MRPRAPILLEPPTATEPVVSVALEAARDADAEKPAAALAQLTQADPSLAVRTGGETGQTLLSGMGELHLEVAVDRIRRQRGITVHAGRRGPGEKEWEQGW